MDRSRGRDAAPVAVLQAAINKVVSAADKKVEAAEPPSGRPAFIPSASFQGVRSGYYFASGNQGVGYYADSKKEHIGAPSSSRELQAEPQKSKRINAEELLKEAEDQLGDGQVELLDAKSLKRLVLSFERKYKDNLEQRMKYADQPDKFMDSEVDLDEEVKKMMAIAATPELYPEFVRLQAVPSLLALLSHENSDIAADVIDLFRELTDSDVVEDQVEAAGVLVDAVVENNGLELLAQRLGGLDESVEEEKQAVFNTLSIIENLVEVRAEVAEMLVHKTKLLKWLLGRLKLREFDSNKQYAAEILAILMQSSSKNQRTLGETGGLDVVLEALALANRNVVRAEGSHDEEEYIADLFDVLCCALLHQPNKALFVQAEGLELMQLVLKQKRISRIGALKTIDFAVTRCQVACERLVDIAALKNLFPIFMSKSKLPKSVRGDDTAGQEEEERVVSIIAQLLQGLAKGSRRDRVAAKFIENEFEKCDRLMELFDRFEVRVTEAEERLAEEMAADEEEIDADEMLLTRMDAGLYTLQMCSLILGNLWLTGDLGIRKRVLTALHQKSRTLAGVRAVLRDYLRNLGDDGGSDEKERQQRRLRNMLEAMGWTAAEEAADGAALESTPPPPITDAAAANGVEHTVAGTNDADVDMEVAEQEPEALKRDPELEKADSQGDEDEKVEVQKRRDRDRDRDRDEHRREKKERERDKERKKEKHRDRDREKERDRERDRDRDRDHKSKRRRDEDGERDRKKNRR